MLTSCLGSCFYLRMFRGAVDMQLRNIRLNTALHFALERNNLEAAKLLLIGGAIIEKNALGLTPFDVGRKSKEAPFTSQGTVPQTGIPPGPCCN